MTDSTDVTESTPTPERLRSELPGLLAAIAFCELAGLIPSALTREEIDDWYQTLDLPERAPSGQVIGTVWTALYAVMGIALHLVRRERSPRSQLAVGAFVAQLGLNVAWTLVFFGGHSPLGGFVTICALLVAIVVTIGAFARVTTWGALLLVPYLAWVAFATTLNYDIWRLNRR